MSRDHFAAFAACSLAGALLASVAIGWPAFVAPLIALPFVWRWSQPVNRAQQGCATGRARRNRKGRRRRSSRPS